MLCPLCQSHDFLKLTHQQVAGDFFHCQKCDLISKDPSVHLGWDEQKVRYDLHRNDIDNPGYVEFFEQLLGPLRPFLGAGEHGLDWGSGPGSEPVLAQLLRQEYAVVDLYDPIYQPTLSRSQYDFITSTEVIEHFQKPRDSFNHILSLLRPGGVFAGLTQFHQGPAEFSKWWYVKDPTHVVFYSDKTFQWAALEWRLEILYLKGPVFIFRKS